MNKQITLVLLLLLSTQFTYAQCILSASQNTQAQVLSCLTSCGCNSVIIPDGVTVAMNGSWDLTSAGDIRIFVSGSSGSLAFSGSGGSAEGLILTDGSSVGVEESSNSTALTQSGGGGIVRISIGSNNFSGNDFADIIAAGSTSALLPVEFGRFAVASKEPLVIEWSTLLELNNLGFEIERSTNAKSWKSVGFVAGKGDSNAELHYRFTDENPLDRSVFYRLKQIDYDGSHDYSEILVVRNDHQVISIVPNPVGEFIQTSLTEEIAVVRIIDGSGRIIAAELSGDGSISTHHLVSGLYRLQLLTEDGWLQSNFVKH